MIKVEEIAEANTRQRAVSKTSFPYKAEVKHICISIVFNVYGPSAYKKQHLNFQFITREFVYFNININCNDSVLINE